MRLINAMLRLNSFQLIRLIAVSVEEVLESLDAVLEEVLEGMSLVRLMLGQDLFVLGSCFPDAISGGIETVGKSLPLGFDLIIIAGGGLFNEVPDPLLDSIDESISVVVFVSASSVSLSLGIFKECTYIVLEVMVIDLADLKLDSLVCGPDVSLLLGNASVDLCSGSGELCVHGLITEGFELGNDCW